MDPSTLETYRQRLLTLQQQIMQRVFDMEASMLAMDAERLFEKSSIGGISSVHAGDERQSIPHRPH